MIAASLQTQYTEHAPPLSDGVRFQQFLYSAQRGYVEILAGRTNPTDPSKIILDMHTRRWLYYDLERPDLIAAIDNYAGQLERSHGNVYISVRLYTRQAKVENKRCEAY